MFLKVDIFDIKSYLNLIVLFLFDVPDYCYIFYLSIVNIYEIY